MVSWKTYRDLDVWILSIELAEIVFKITKLFPKEEIYGITSQMRRSAISISSNIAEGYARNSPNDFIRFLNISNGSLAELQTQLIICEKIGYINNDAFQEIFDKSERVAKLLYGLKKHLANNQN